jgi:hypothetical protein
MTCLKQLAASLTLMSVMAIPAFAGETESPPCAPGEVNSPPCISQSITDSSIAPGETSAPPSSSVDVTDLVDAVRWALSIF